MIPTDTSSTIYLTENRLFFTLYLTTEPGSMVNNFQGSTQIRSEKCNSFILIPGKFTIDIRVRDDTEKKFLKAFKEPEVFFPVPVIHARFSDHYKKFSISLMLL